MINVGIDDMLGFGIYIAGLFQLYLFDLFFVQFIATRENRNIRGMDTRKYGKKFMIIIFY